MSREDVACYRLYAANCVEIAGRISDTDRRLFLLRMAQAWGNLAEHAEKAGLAASVATGLADGLASSLGSDAGRGNQQQPEANSAFSQQAQNARMNGPGSR